MCQADFGFLPVHLFTFPLVCLGGVRLYDGYHPTVHFDDHDCAAAGLCGPNTGLVGHLENLLGVPLSNAAYGALAQNNAVVPNQFVHDLGEGLIGPKVGDCALWRARTASVADFGVLRKGAYPPTSVP
jgi:hypothetical protein